MSDDDTAEVIALDDHRTIAIDDLPVEFSTSVEFEFNEFRRRYYDALEAVRDFQEAAIALERAPSPVHIEGPKAEADVSADRLIAQARLSLIDILATTAADIEGADE